MSVSMLCDLDMVVVFGKFCCLVLMESDNSKVCEGFRKGDLYIVDSLQDHSLPHVYLQRLQNVGYGIDDLVMLG